MFAEAFTSFDGADRGSVRLEVSMGPIGMGGTSK